MKLGRKKRKEKKKVGSFLLTFLHDAVEKLVISVPFICSTYKLKWDLIPFPS